VFELRLRTGGGRVVLGDSSLEEVSWVKSAACSRHLAIVPPERCMTFSSPDQVAPTKVACCTSTKVQILTLRALHRQSARATDGARICHSISRAVAHHELFS
jgi:hypothetical protein